MWYLSNNLMETILLYFAQGSSPAGGCLLAISTEYRVFVEGKHTIGLNETQLGIAAPKWFMDPFISLVGYRQTELALLRYVRLN